MESYVHGLYVPARRPRETRETSSYPGQQEVMQTDRLFTQLVPLVYHDNLPCVIYAPSSDVSYGVARFGLVELGRLHLASERYSERSELEAWNWNWNWNWSD